MALRLTNAAWLALLFNVATVRATLFWTYTSRMVESVSSSAYTYYDGEVTAMERTYTRTVSSTVTPAATVTPFSTSTYERTYADIEIVYAYYTTGAFAESDLEPDYYTMTDETTTTGPSTSTRYYMNYTLTAPSSCSTSFEFTTSTYVYIPSEVTPLITPVSTIAASPSTGYYDVYYEATWYLSNSAAPYSSESDYYWTSYVSRCTAPAAAYTGGTRSGGGDSDSDRGYTYCSIYGGCTSWKVWVIVIATIIPALFLLGLLESWFWFRRLMLGKKALRFGTICWVLISLWVLCFTRVQNARSFEDQKLLREKWRAMKAGQKFSLWFKWGFRHSYPVEHLGQYSPNTVGIVPAGQPLHTQMAQAPPGFQPGPGYPPGAPPPGFVPQGAPMPPPGQVYYPPPQGWVPAQPGQFPTPPQGYAYAPPPGTTGYYEQTKDGSMVSTSPIPVPPPQPSVSPPAPYGVSPPPPPASASEAPVSPQSPQPIHPPQLVQTQPAEVPADAPQAPAPAAQPPHGPS